MWQALISACVTQAITIGNGSTMKRSVTPTGHTASQIHTANRMVCSMNSMLKPGTMAISATTPVRTEHLYANGAHMRLIPNKCLKRPRNGRPRESAMWFFALICPAVWQATNFSRQKRRQLNL